MGRVVSGMIGAVVLGVLGAAALALVLLHLRAVSSPRVYSVTEVQAGLQQHPRQWIGRTVRVQGAVDLAPTMGCSSPALLCQSTTFIYLGPSGAPQWSQTQKMVEVSQLNMMAAIAQLPANQRRSFTSLWATMSSRAGGVPSLLVVLPSGMSVPVAQRQGALPASVYSVPVLGALLAHIFPVDNRLVVQIRLTVLQSCITPNNTLCIDGVLLPT